MNSPSRLSDSDDFLPQQICIWSIWKKPLLVSEMFLLESHDASPFTHILFGALYKTPEEWSLENANIRNANVELRHWFCMP